MKKMKLIAAVLAIMMSISFAACTTETNDETPSGHVHQWGEWTVTEESTCVKEGEETRVCELDSSHKETRPVAIDSTAHSWGEWVLTKSPSYTEAGEETRTCKNDSKHVERRSVDKLQHAPIAEMTLTSSESYSLIRGIADEDQGVTSDATAQIEVKVKYEGGSTAAATSEDVEYKTSDAAVASVDGNGLITFNGVGTATITVKSKYEKQGGGYMEKQISITVNAPPENNTGLEVISFEFKIRDDGKKSLQYVIKNIKDDFIIVKYVDVYYLDASGKIIGTGYLPLESSMTSTIINAGQEIQHSMTGDIIFPEDTTKILIYNRRTN